MIFGIISVMTIGYTITKLKALKAAVLADGKIDWAETDELLAAARNLAVRYGFVFQDFEQQILKCREDGKITAEESEKLALQLDYLCASFANRRFKFWLFAAALLALAASVALVAFGVARANSSFATRPGTRKSNRRFAVSSWRSASVGEGLERAEADSVLPVGQSRAGQRTAGLAEGALI